VHHSTIIIDCSLMLQLKLFIIKRLEKIKDYNAGISFKNIDRCSVGVRLHGRFLRRDRDDEKTQIGVCKCATIASRHLDRTDKE
jgi:hypothetical protein